MVHGLDGVGGWCGGGRRGGPAHDAGCDLLQVSSWASFVHGTLRDDAAAVLADGTDAVLHFAAKSLVGESVAHPGLYWSHNLGGSLALFEAMQETGVRRIVFS